MNFPEFRLKIAALIRSANRLQSPWIKKHLELIEDVDYEGPAVQDIYDAFRCYECDTRDEDPSGSLYNGFDDWFEDNWPLIHDAIINAHPGLCPSEIAEEVSEIFERIV